MYKKDFSPIIYVNCRLVVVFACISIIFSVLLIKIALLQFVDSNKLIYNSDLRSLRIEKIPTSRGIIFDRTGKLLAINVLIKSVCADPKIIFHNYKNILNKNKWKSLSKIISQKPQNLLKLIARNPNSRFVCLSKRICENQIKHIKNLNIKGIYIQEKFKRYYPNGISFSQIIGITNVDLKGIEGIEKKYNKNLSGIPGIRKIRINRKREIVESNIIKQQILSKNITLSIDKKLQIITSKNLNNAVIANKAKSGIAVLIYIPTGEILAMANSPVYDPNRIPRTLSNNIRNRAIADAFEPGSTIKPIVLIAALEKKLIKENSILNTNPYWINKKKIQDVSYNKKLNITEILKKSSNVGISKIAFKIPFKYLIDTYSKFGIGKPTYLGLNGERTGFLPNRNKWSALEKATFSFGYGLLMTPLQLARLYATIGSYGIYKPLSIIKVNTSTVYGEKIFSKKVTKKIIKMMESVSSPGGSGSAAAVKNFRIAIKTGTAKKLGHKGHYVSKYISYTAGIAPASNPKFSLIIIIDEPKAGKYYGGAVSAPIFGSIMKLTLKLMNIKPDA